MNSGKCISGEVPKLAEGTPLERVQVVNSGARVQIPPSPLADDRTSGAISAFNTVVKTGFAH